MTQYNGKSSYDEELILVTYASEAAGSTDHSSVEVGPLREGAQLVVNIGAVASTGTVLYAIKASLDDSTFVTVITTPAYTATGQVHIPIGPHVDPATGNSYKYWKVSSTVANAAVSHGAYIAL